MADEIVLARSKRTQRIAPMSRRLAESTGAEVLDESPYNADGSLKRMTTKTGRPIKPKTTVATEVAAKAVTPSASTEKE